MTFQIRLRRSVKIAMYIIKNDAFVFTKSVVFSFDFNCSALNVLKAKLPPFNYKSDRSHMRTDAPINRHIIPFLQVRITPISEPTNKKGATLTKTNSNR